MSKKTPFLCLCIFVLLFSAGVCRAENSYREFMRWTVDKLGSDPDAIWGVGAEQTLKVISELQSFECKQYQDAQRIKRNAPEYHYFSCRSGKGFTGTYQITAHFFDDRLVALEYSATDPTIAKEGPEFGGSNEELMFSLWLSEKYSLTDFEEVSFSPFRYDGVTVIGRAQINSKTYYYFGEEERQSLSGSYKLHWIFMSADYLAAIRPYAVPE